MTTKEALHNLVDELPESEVSAAVRYLEYLRDTGDPFVKALLAAPIDDEPDIDEEREGADASWREYLDGHARPWEDVREELNVE